MYHRYLRYEEEGTKKQLNRGGNNASGVHLIGHNLKYFLFSFISTHSSLVLVFPGSVETDVG